MNKHVLELFDKTVALKDRIRPVLEIQEKNFGLKDFRTILISRPLNSIVLQILFFKANQTTIYNHDWWDKINVPIEGRKGFAERFDMFYKHYGFIQFISIVESEFRILIRKIWPGSCNNGNSSFNSIYSKILSELKLNEFKELFDFVRLIRNTVHNNGTYLPEKNTGDKILNFKSKQYTFSYGEKIDFFFSELLADIEEEIFNCLFKIIEHDKIKNFKEKKI